jgi:hypothetical protein
MDILYALLIALGLRHNAPGTVKPLPLVIQPGTVETIPDPLPYVLESYEWGPR